MREILAVKKVLQSFAPKLAVLCVKWQTDNRSNRKLVRKANLSVFLRFALIMAFLLSLNGCPDPERSKHII